MKARRSSSPLMNSGPFVQTYRLRIVDLLRDTFECTDHVGALVGKPHVDRRREAREGIDNRKYTDLLTIKELVVAKSIFQTWLGSDAGDRPSRSFA